jgi:large conductance mechanosensitive channel
MLKGFGQFIARGNVVDLAVAVVMGAAFGAIVTAFVKDLITPLVAALFGKPNFAVLGFTINHSRFAVGDFLNALLAFVLVAAAVYYFVVVPMNAIVERVGSKPAEAPAVPIKACPRCLSEIAAAATRCKFCCADIG